MDESKKEFWASLSEPPFHIFLCETCKNRKEPEYSDDDTYTCKLKDSTCKERTIDERDLWEWDGKSRNENGPY